MSMEARALTTEPRSITGKGAARQLRAQDKMPAIFYGPKMEAVALTLSPKELMAALSTDYRRNQLLSLTIDGQERHALVKELQVDPVTRAPLHVDLYGLNPDTVIERKVPLRTTGRAAGVVAGGELRVLFRFLPVSGPASSIPADVTIDVTRMNMGDVVKVKDLPLPKEVSVVMAPDRGVISVAMGRRRSAKGEGEGEGETKGK